MGAVADAGKSARAALRTGVFLLKVLPNLPSRALDFVTPDPIVEVLEYPTLAGTARGDVYRPPGPGPYPALVVCLGVVPFEVDHPQVPRLGEALARSGLAALLYWSPAMRDFRLDAEDIENIALAYDRLLEQPYVDASRSGLLGTCVGGSFALMAGASPRIRSRVAFIGAFAPYGSLQTLAVGVASSTRRKGKGRQPWPVDQLTRKVFVHSITARLEPAEAEELRSAFLDAEPAPGAEGLSEDGQAVRALLVAADADEAERAVSRLPGYMREGLADLSPVSYAADIDAPLVAISHDRDDLVIPVEESRLLVKALAGREGVHYTEFELFEHADPTKRHLSPLRLGRQLGLFYLWLHALFRQSEG